MSVRFGAVIIGVNNILVSKSFYERVLGVTFHEVRPPFSSFSMNGIEFQIEENSSDRDSDWSTKYIGTPKNLCFETDNIEKFLDRVIQNGGTHTEIIHHSWGYREAHFKDLDGNDFIVEQEMNKKINNFAFIDSQNVNLNIKSQGWELDWNRFRIYLKEKYHVEQAYLFIGYLEGNNTLYAKLQKAGFICIFKPTLIYKDGTTKGNCDAELILQSMIEYSNFDKAIIVTGDGDFHCLVKYFLEQEKLEVVLIPNMMKYSALLKKFGKKQIAFMNGLKNKIGKK